MQIDWLLPYRSGSGAAFTCLNRAFYSVQRLARLFAVQGMDWGLLDWVEGLAEERNFFEMPTENKNDSTLAHRHRSL